MAVHKVGVADTCSRPSRSVRETCCVFVSAVPAAPIRREGLTGEVTATRAAAARPMCAKAATHWRTESSSLVAGAARESTTTVVAPARAVPAAGHEPEAVPVAPGPAELRPPAVVEPLTATAVAV